MVAPLYREGLEFRRLYTLRALPSKTFCLSSSLHPEIASMYRLVSSK